MAVAALSAVALREQLHDGHRPGFGRRLQQAIDRTTRRAWTTSRVLNLLYLAPKPSLAVGLIRRCAVRALDAAGDRPVLHNALYNVLSSSAPITTVLAPGPVLAGIRGPRRQSLPGPPLGTADTTAVFRGTPSGRASLADGRKGRRTVTAANGWSRTRDDMGQARLHDQDRYPSLSTTGR
ncbi:hypothetical protein AB5J49_44255 [Streptomyces sp. R28]|uniref:Uncharacterized protein n=1 Tax=Streptomyces sp. R28 TaxID=3238628 RepID=A0AB39QA63_9ACTN